MRVAPSTAKATALCNKALMPGVFCLKIERKKKNKEERDGYWGKSNSEGNKWLSIFPPCFRVKDAEEEEARRGP